MNLSNGFQREQRRVALGMVSALLLSAVVLATLAWLPPFAMPDLPTPEARLAFTVRLDVLLFAWHGATIANVARQRFFSIRDIGGSEQAAASPAVLRANAVLQNTLEQAVFAFGSHLALAAQLSSRWVIMLPGLVGLFCLGRALFWMGYRGGAAARAFGFALTFYPSAGACIVALVLLLR